MQKDYLPLKQASQQQEEKFVADYWTARWQKLPIKNQDINRVVSAQEFKAIKKYLPFLPAGAKILDGGCGLGMWTRYFNSLGYKTTGLDISEATIKRLKRLYPQEKFVFGDIRATSFKKDSFDGYISWGTFEHFENGLSAAFIEARRILKPRGMLFITVPYQNWRHLIKGFFKHKTKNGNYHFYQWRLTPVEIAREAEMNGFEVVSIGPIHKAHGVRQFVNCDLGIPPASVWHWPFKVLFYFILPGFFVSHMLMAIVKKR